LRFPGVALFIAIRHPKTAISEYFCDIEDPRVDRRKRHKLIDIITITICAVISGVEHWTEIQSYGETKYN
jgi:hypothetical protein